MTVSGNILVTGGTGLFGPFLCEALRPLGTVVAQGRRSGDVTADLADAAQARTLMKDLKPDCVVNLVACTNVDQCETDPIHADMLNRGIVENLCASLREDATIVQISTDQVYSGDGAPHRENDTGPINVYGKSKLAGERAAIRHPNALVLRANFFGPSRTPGRTSLSDWLIRSLTEKAPVTGFSDSLFSPLHLQTAADTVVDLLRRDARGIFNLGCRGGMSKADFAFAVARHLDLDSSVITVGRSADLPGRAPRPKDMRMDVGALEAFLGHGMPTLLDEIHKLGKVEG